MLAELISKSKPMSSPALAPPHTSSTGIFLVTISAIIWSTAGIFAKVVSADVWTILFWRGVFSAGFILAYLAWSQGRGLLHDFRRLGAPGWAAAIIGAAATVCFITSFKHTTIANVGIIYATAPFIAALLGWLLIRERPGRANIIGAIVALSGVVIMVTGSFGTPNLFGDGMAFLMTLGMAAYIVLIRKYPDVPMVLAGALSAVILALAAPVMTDPFTASTDDVIWLIGFGSVFAAATILMTLGTRLVPASQSALIGALETPLAPIWAWLLLSELPPLATWIGGAIVFSAVLYSIARTNADNSGQV